MTSLAAAAFGGEPPLNAAEAERVLQSALAGLRRLCIAADIDQSHGTTHAKRVLAHVERALLAAVPQLPLERELAVRLAALLHDADDRKYFPDKPKGRHPNAERLLAEAYASKSVTDDVLEMIALVSCSSNGNSAPEEAREKPELLWPRWADRLEATGAIGVVRCFQYNQATGAPLSLPDTPRPTSAEEAWALATPERFDAYQASGGGSASMIDHYFDKLLQVSRPPPEIVQNVYLEAAAEQRAAPLLKVLLDFGRSGEVPVAHIRNLAASLARNPLGAELIASPFSQENQYCEAPPDAGPGGVRPLTRAELQQLTVKDLRGLLRERGLPVTGVKSDLVNRLLESAGMLPPRQPEVHTATARRCEAFAGAERKQLRALRRRRLGAAADLAAAESETAVWGAEWLERLECWFVTMPGPTQSQLGGCVGALALHIGGRIESAWNAAQTSLGRSAPGGRGAIAAAATAEPNCEWVADGLPELPAFPEFPAIKDFALPPLPRLIPSWEKLLSLAEDAPAAGALGDAVAAADSPQPHTSRTPLAMGAGAALGFAAGAAIAIVVTRLRRRRRAKAARVSNPAETSHA